MLGSAADAEDVVQTVFADLVQRGRVTVDLPYLFRAVTSRCLNLARDRTNRLRLIDRQAPALRGLVRTRCDDEVIGTDLMLKLVDRLDPPSAEVLVYRYFDDMTQDEIAAMQEVSRKTVAARLERVRQALRVLIEERAGDDRTAR
jgi:RNA polymerase sigma factor (sigma-70 family)